jgi:hypothetical protein
MDLIIQRRLPHLGGGWFASECPADLERNRWPVWIGMGGRFASEYTFTLSLSKGKLRTFAITSII